MQAFNHTDVLAYINAAFDLVNNDEDFPENVTMIFICNIYFMKIIARQLAVKAPYRKCFKNFVLEVFALMIDCKQLAILKTIFRNFIIIIGSPSNTPLVESALEEMTSLARCRTKDGELRRLIDDAKSADINDEKKDRAKPTYRLSKFFLTFEDIYHQVNIFKTTHAYVIFETWNILKPHLIF
jgi:hypothetical protein